MKNALQTLYQIILPCKGFLCVRSRLTGGVVPDFPIQASIYWYTNMAIMRRSLFPRPPCMWQVINVRRRKRKEGLGNRYTSWHSRGMCKSLTNAISYPHTR